MRFCLYNSVACVAFCRHCKWTGRSVVEKMACTTLGTKLKKKIHDFSIFCSLGNIELIIYVFISTLMAIILSEISKSHPLNIISTRIVGLMCSRPMLSVISSHPHSERLQFQCHITIYVAVHLYAV